MCTTSRTLGGTFRDMRKFGVIAVVGLLAVVGVVVNGGGTTEVAEPASIEAQAEQLLDLGPLELIANQYGQAGVTCTNIGGGGAQFFGDFSSGGLGLSSSFSTTQAATAGGLSSGPGNGTIIGGNLRINVFSASDCASFTSGNLVAVGYGTLANGDSFAISFVAP